MFDRQPVKWPQKGLRVGSSRLLQHHTSQRVLQTLQLGNRRRWCTVQDWVAIANACPTMLHANVLATSCASKTGITNISACRQEGLRYVTDIYRECTLSEYEGSMCKYDLLFTSPCCYSVISPRCLACSSIVSQTINSNTLRTFEVNWPIIIRNRFVSPFKYILFQSPGTILLSTDFLLCTIRVSLVCLQSWLKF